MTSSGTIRGFFVKHDPDIITIIIRADIRISVFMLYANFLVIVNIE
jgi:hypothetical protein